jgi:hypothetical protein
MWFMKSYIISLAVLFAFIQVSTAADVTLAWDPNSQPEPAGHELSYGNSSGQYGTTTSYGSIELFKVSKNSPSGTCEINTRLIDPLMGHILSEDINPFYLQGGVSSKAPTAVLNSNVVLEASPAESGYPYIISNKSTESATVELKVWIEAGGGNRILYIRWVAMVRSSYPPNPI